MIEIDDKIISTDLLAEEFACCLDDCKGACCVEGNAGAPLEANEEAILKQEYANYKPYMTPEGVAEVEKQGFAVLDQDGDLTTPLVGDAECAYSFQKDGLTLCAIEAAYREGKTTFKKPISCHLYPIRVKRFSNGTEGLNIHRWDICRNSYCRARKQGVKLYESLREPIIRRWGQEFYEQIEEAAKHLDELTY